MNGCPSPDRLLGMAEAAEWRPLSVLDHVAACASCRAELGDIERIGSVVGEREPPSPGFAERVRRALGEEVPVPTSPRERKPAAVLFAVVTAVAASLASLVTILLVAGGPPAQGSPLAMAGIVVAVGAGVFARELRRAPRTARVQPAR